MSWDCVIHNRLINFLNMSQNQSTEKLYNPFKVLVVFTVIILGATLPFHYIPEHSMIFPKDNLTFSNTYTSQEDIDKLIDRYNNASIFEKQAINQEPFMRKLMEKGIIMETKNKR